MQLSQAVNWLRTSLPRTAELGEPLSPFVGQQLCVNRWSESLRVQTRRLVYRASNTGTGSTVLQRCEGPVIYPTKEGRNTTRSKHLIDSAPALRWKLSFERSHRTSHATHHSNWWVSAREAGLPHQSTNNTVHHCRRHAGSSTFQYLPHVSCCVPTSRVASLLGVRTKPGKRHRIKNRALLYNSALLI